MLYNLTYFNHNKNWPLDLSLKTFELGREEKKKPEFCDLTPKDIAFVYYLQDFPFSLLKPFFLSVSFFYFGDGILLCSSGWPPALGFPI